MNTYELSRNFWNWAFDNPEKIKPIHSAIFFFALEHCNRLGNKEKFGFPSQMTMDAIGVKKYQTYGKALHDLENWGFITFIEKSKNQYSANIIKINAVPKNGKARGKALDKATVKHGRSTGQSTGQGKDSINKPIYHITNKPIITPLPPKDKIFNIWLDYRSEIKKPIKSEKTLESLAKKFDAHDFKVCELVVNKSIENQWQGLFWDKAELKKESRHPAHESNTF